MKDIALKDRISLITWGSDLLNKTHKKSTNQNEKNQSDIKIKTSSPRHTIRRMEREAISGKKVTASYNQQRITIYNLSWGT